MKNILVTRSSMPPFEEYCSEIKELWENSHSPNKISPIRTTFVLAGSTGFEPVECWHQKPMTYRLSTTQWWKIITLSSCYQNSSIHQREVELFR